MAELYIQGALVVEDVLHRKGSLKSLVMAKAKESKGKVDAKRLLALSANTLAFMKPLRTVIECIDLCTLEKKAFMNVKNARGIEFESLALVLAHDLLFSSRGRVETSPAWPPHAAVQRHASRLRSELVKLQIKQGKSSIQELRAGIEVQKRVERIPRWVRVNERITEVETVITDLKKEGWNEEDDVLLLSNKKASFARSQHVPCVLAFHPSQTSTLIAHELYKSGRIFLQDLASCFPAKILLNEQVASHEVHVIDATSAPGNKTTHLSAILAKGAKKSTVVAMEHMQPRYKVLMDQLRRAGALASDLPGSVSPRLCDFMKQDPQAFPQITHMLLDPSCSGSGILGRLDHLTDKDEQDTLETPPSDLDGVSVPNERLRGLATFQQNMIEKAMQYPSLKRLVYSTCSVHHEENEDVVMQALHSEVACSRGWQLCSRADCIPSWPIRGLAQYCHNNPSWAEAMIRCVPGGADWDKEQGLSLEATNGFFVTCFVRDTLPSALPPAKSNEKNRKRKLRAKEKARAEKRKRSEEHS